MNEEYPIFSGRVINVPAVVDMGEEGVFTIVDYISVEKMPSDDEVKKTMPYAELSFLFEEHVDKAKKLLEDRAIRVIIPMKLDPSVILGAEIRTCFAQANSGEYGEGKSHDTYELEVIKGRSQAGGDFVVAMRERAKGEPFTGIKYVRYLGI